MSGGKEQYQIVAFFVSAKPDYLQQSAPGAVGIQLATELLGLRVEDFHPKHAGRFDGHNRNGWCFEVYVKRDAAQGLLARNHPNVLGVFD